MWDGKCLPMSTDKGAEPAELTDARKYGRPFFSLALMSTKLAADAPSYLLIRHCDSHCRHRVTSAYRISVLIFYNVTFLRLICQLCTLSPRYFRPLGVILGLPLLSTGPASTQDRRLNHSHVFNINMPAPGELGEIIPQRTSTDTSFVL